MRIKITSDSTCDLSAELLSLYNITLIPLSVIREGKPYKDGTEIAPKDIFGHVEAGGALCSTAAVNVEDYRTIFSEYASKYEGVIHINIGSGFSSCHQNAAIAAADFPNVYVVDSLSLSTGQGHLVVEAAQLAQAGLSPLEITSRINAMRRRVDVSFIMDRLEYMQKGGRCSSVMALGSKVLKIKPCIAVQEGALKLVDKYRGSFSKCVEKYVKDRLKDRKGLRLDRVFITHTPVDAEAVKAAREVIEKYAPGAVIFETQAGCTISCHCGPGTLGIMFVVE